MKNKINKTLNLILLLSVLNGNILSMQKSDIEPNAQIMEIDQDVQQELSLLGLPAEVIEYIIYQIVKPYENRVENINNIFEFYSRLDLKPLVSDLSGISLTSKDFRLWTLDLINRLKKLKGNKYQELINQIKDQYQDLSKYELNSRFKNILNQLSVNRNDLEEAAKLILAGANVNEKNNIGYTALMLAVNHDYKDIVQLLIDNKANVNEKNINGYTALILAEINGHKDIVELLIDNKADVNKKNINGYTALIWAAMKGHKDIVQLLIDNGANVNEKNILGYTALMLAATFGHKDIVQLLIDNKADVNEKNNGGETALMLAAFKGHQGIVQLLIDNKADVNEKDILGYTALMWAKKYNYIDIISLLRRAGAKDNYNCIVF